MENFSFPELTRAQSRIIEAVGDFYRRNAIPTVPELVQQLPIVGESSLTPTLKLIAEKGYLTVQGGGAGGVRTVTLTETGQVAAGIAFPVLGEIPAGPIAEAVQEWQEIINPGNALRTHKGDFFLRVNGTSMIDVGILSGDLALLRPGIEIGNGEIAAVQVNDKHQMLQSTLKKVFRRGKEMHLVAANPDVQPMIFPTSMVSIVGAYRGLLRHHSPGR